MRSAQRVSLATSTPTPEPAPSRRSSARCWLPARLGVTWVLILLALGFAGAEAAGPVTLGELRSFFLIGKPDTEIAAEIEARGVAFAVTREVIADLRGKGAGSATLAALRSRLAGPLLVVKVQPGESEVLVDGGAPTKTSGTGGARIKGLAPGKHTILVRKPGFRDWTGSVTLAAGEETVLERSLQPGPSMIVWKTDLPGASVQIDGRAVDGQQEGQQEGQAEVEPGQHSVVFECPVCEPVRHEITVAPGERRELAPGLVVDPGAVATLRESLVGARQLRNLRTGAEVAETLVHFLPDDPAVIAALAEGSFFEDDATRFVELGKRAISAGESVRVPVRHRDTMMTAELVDAYLKIDGTSIVFEPLHEPCGWDDRTLDLARITGVEIDADEATLWLAVDVLLPGEKKPDRFRFADRGSEFEPTQRVKSLGGILAIKYTGRNMIIRSKARGSLSSIRDLLGELTSDTR